MTKHCSLKNDFHISSFGKKKKRYLWSMWFGVVKIC